MPNHDQENFSTAPSSAEMHDWPELLAKMVDDAAKLFSAELHLFEAHVKAMIEAQMQRLVGTLIAVSALAYGFLFVLGALAVLLHQTMPWWLSLGITGLGVIASGMTAQFALSRSAGENTKSPWDSVIAGTLRRETGGDVPSTSRKAQHARERRPRTARA